MTLKEFFDKIGVEREYASFSMLKNRQLADIDTYLRSEVIRRESGVLEVRICIPFDDKNDEA